MERLAEGGFETLTIGSMLNDLTTESSSITLQNEIKIVLNIGVLKLDEMEKQTFGCQKESSHLAFLSTSSLSSHCKYSYLKNMIIYCCLVYKLIYNVQTSVLMQTVHILVRYTYLPFIHDVCTAAERPGKSTGCWAHLPQLRQEVCLGGRPRRPQTL